MHASLPDANSLIAQLADAIAPTLAPNTVIVGIHTGGVWVAERLHILLKCTQPLGTLDISFYRDDFSRIGLHPQVKPSNLPFDLEGRDILLVDDVLHSGRTVRAAMNELFDYGRPGLDPAGGAGRPRRPRTADPPRFRRPQPRRARPPEHQSFPPRRRPSDPLPCMNPQLTPDGRLRHLLTLDGLPRAILTQILDTAESFMDVGEREVKKVPLLRGKSIFNLFFEPSTRTRTTFEIAAKRLSADVVNLNIATSSQTKGEAILDTVDNLSAMHADMFIVRHSQSGAAHFIARHVAPHISVVNAGDGRHAHPTQGLLDMFTIRRYKGDFHNLTVAIVGDVLHSRVARSQIHALTTLGVPEVRVIGPKTLLPTGVEQMGVKVFHNMEDGLRGCDVVIMLRLQNERMKGALLPSAQEYFKFFGLTTEKLALAKPDAIVMHPGPMNRGVEIDSEVADGPQSVILPQVTYGIAVRMAVMALLAGTGNA